MSDDEAREVASARLGKVLRGKYRLDRVLGIGGMATVYAATHRNKKRFAIKMLHPELSVREGIRTRFLREGYVANSVDHSGAVAVLDDDVAEDGSAFLVMELLEGSPLDALASKHEGHKLPVSVALSIADALLDVLAAAHAKGIVHRDLKPANVFLTDDGRIEVLDFGIARLHDETSHAQHATQTGAMLGTPAFMAPEQALAEQSKIDAQTDLWAVGATLFTLLSGALVHEGQNASQLMIRAGTSRARSLASVAPQVPKAVAEVVDRALAFEKKDRWESARAMREALAKACVEATGAPIAPLPKTERVTGLEETVASDARLGNAAIPRTFSTTAAGVASSPARRHSRKASILLIGALMLAMGVGFQWRRARQEATPHAGGTSASARTDTASRQSRHAATPEAQAAWEAAVQAEHDGDSRRAERSLMAAVASDPSLAAAHLRLAMRDAGLHVRSMRAAREEYRLAVEHRATLGEVDAALLDAVEPRFRQPPDAAEHARRMETVADAYPADPRVQTALASAQFEAGQPFSGAIDRAIAADRACVPIYETWFYIEREGLGDWSGEQAVSDRCIAVAPSSVDCIWQRAWVHNVEGRCDEMSGDARRVLAADPKSVDAYWWLALTAVAKGESSDIVDEALSGAQNLIEDSTARQLDHSAADAWLAILKGDFAVAAQRRADSVAALRASRGESAATSALLRAATFALEAGDAASARSFVGKARALALASPDRDDHAAGLARLSARVGIFTREQRIAETDRLWMKETQNQALPNRLHEWLSIYAGEPPVYDEDDARDAMGVFEREKLEVSSSVDPSRAELAATVLALAGHFHAAVPPLQRAVVRCGSYVDPSLREYERISNVYLLGLSLENTGDFAGAKTAYERVVSRWGNAKPRSVTADKARAGLARLAKATPPR